MSTIDRMKNNEKKILEIILLLLFTL
jgi:hypothetical protein